MRAQLSNIKVLKSDTKMAVAKKSKNQLRREKQKLLKKQSANLEGATNKNKNDNESISKPQKQSISTTNSIDAGVSNAVTNQEPSSGKMFETEFDALLEKPEFAQFKHVFDKFHMEEPNTVEQSKGDIMDSEDDQNPEYGEGSDDEKDDQPKMSKKKQRKANKIPLAELKAASKYPELVQWYDVDAADPVLVVEIKSKKNYVPVPAHWQFKREYLSGRRSIEKKPFTLPKFISETGITDMRDTTKEDESNMKQRMREKVQPKMNRLDLDYQKLHDAFFKFQTKPRLFGFGDVYFEGRENEELDISKYKPGVVSDELRNALGIPRGVTLPWVQKMQHFGPPPNYPDLKIPGYNVDLSEEETMFADDVAVTSIDNVETEPFGKLLSYESSEDEEEEEDDEEEEEEEVDEEEADAYLSDSELKQASGIENENVDVPTYEAEENSDEEDVPLAEVETRNSPVTEEDDQQPKKLYHVVKESEQTDSGLMSSKRAYDLTDVQKSSTSDPRKKPKVKEIIENKETGDDDEDDDEEESGKKFRF